MCGSVCMSMCGKLFNPLHFIKLRTTFEDARTTWRMHHERSQGK